MSVSVSTPRRGTPGHPFLTGGRALAAALACLLLLDLRATTVRPPDFQQLCREPDFIVRAVVRTVVPEIRTSGSRRVIYTRVELEVREVIAGNPPVPLVLEMLGGRVGSEELRIEGAPRFSVGDEDILFIKDNGTSVTPLLAMMHGRYPVLKEAATGRRFVARSNRVPLADVSEVADPFTDGPAALLQQRMKRVADALSPEDFIVRIKATRSAAGLPSR